MKKVFSLLLAIMICVGLAVTSYAQNHENEGSFAMTKPYLTMGTYTVIGDDNRTTISNSLRNTFPFSAIGKLTIYYEDGCEGQGTGYMVSEHCMLTAAHSFMCRNHASPLYSMSAKFGYGTGAVQTVAYPESTVMEHNPAYTSHSSSSAHDYGYVVFNGDIGNDTGWFTMYAPSTSVLVGKVATVCGYESNALKSNFNTISSATSTVIKYQIDTDEGQSGAPVYWNDSNYGYVAVGIHVKGTPDDVSGFNSAWRITEDFIDELDQLGYVEKIT